MVIISITMLMIMVMLMTMMTVMTVMMVMMVMLARVLLDLMLLPCKLVDCVSIGQGDVANCNEDPDAGALPRRVLKVQCC